MKKTFNYFLAGLLLAMLLVSLLLFKTTMAGDNTSIKISETKSELAITSYFPDSKSERVQTFLKTKLDLGDLPNLDRVEINDYSTPDKLLTFYIKSKPGYIKILLDKDRNDSHAYAVIKETGEELKTVLTH